MISRREFLAETAGLVAWGALARPLFALPPATRITVYKDASCQCCNHWVEHLKLNGFETEAHDVDALEAVKNRYGVPKPLWSCHTALVGEYVVEGHVPADDIQRLLKERPKLAGLAVPGMPASAPGMYQPGDRKVPYEVVAFTKSGATSIYAKH